MDAGSRELELRHPTWSTFVQALGQVTGGTVEGMASLLFHLRLAIRSLIRGRAPGGTLDVAGPVADEGGLLVVDPGPGQYKAELVVVAP